MTTPTAEQVYQWFETANATLHDSLTEEQTAITALLDSPALDSESARDLLLGVSERLTALLEQVATLEDRLEATSTATAT